MSETSTSHRPIYSTLSSDPDLGELVELFVEEMPERIRSLTEAYDCQDYDELCRFAHQMKGASGSYGFTDLTPAASDLEQHLRQNASQDEIQSALDTLVDMCRRVTAQTPT